MEKINAYSYRLGKEAVYLWISIFITLAYYAWALLSLVVDHKSNALLGPSILLGLAFLYLFLHLLGMAAIRINSVKVGPNQFPAIWKSAKTMSERLGLSTVPDMYIVHAGGELNAFATRLVSRKMLVLFSDLADALVEGDDQRQLDAVVAHELAHHALNHTHIYNIFLGPADFLPALSSALSRAREYSADRVMKALIGDSEVCYRALVKLVSGKTLGNKVNIEEYTKQIEEEGGFFVWLSEKLSTHPHLPNRIVAIGS